MPALVRKLLVLAAIEGLVLQPLAQRHQRPATPVLIEYKTHKIKPLTKVVDNSENVFVESHGIVGELTCNAMLGGQPLTITYRPLDRRISFVPCLNIPAPASCPNSRIPCIRCNRCCLNTFVFSSRCATRHHPDQGWGEAC